MKPAPFVYHRPRTLDEAVALLASEPDAKVMAGGQSLVPLLSMRLAGPATIVDVSAVAGLATLVVDDGGVRVGAMVRHTDLLADPDARRVQPLLGAALAHVAHPTIRNRGTTVGSIVHADAAAEMPVVLAVLEGSVDVVGPHGGRTIAAADLVVGPLESSLAPDEIATSAWFPALAPGAGVGFAEIARRRGDYAVVGVAALVEAGGRARVGYLSVGDVPTVVDVTGVDPADAGEAALAHLEPGGDVHASAAYRAQLVRALTARVLREADAHRQTRQGAA